ncbi:MAG: iron-sulfur cluster insertion protein ErpA [Proteobacteria bacterium]|nr:iron-sulfur cluster insertion protein ErpA [Pseudomonadota bacterium]
MTEAMTEAASPSPNLLSLSESAVKRVGTLLQNEDEGAMLRVTVSGGGCSGFQYGFAFDHTKNGDDELVEQNGIKVVIDNMSLMYVAGSQIDYVEDLIGASFSISNPNATSACSCGSSFAV